MVRTLLAALFLIPTLACGGDGPDSAVHFEEICGNRIDDDGNGLDDFADPACAIEPALLAAMQTMVEEARTALTTAMVVGARTADGKVAFVANGTTQAEGGRALEPDDRFPVGSITKTMTATVVLQLVEEGKLSLDGNISEWLPDFPRADRISVRHLLNHTSGIFDYTTSRRYSQWANSGKQVTVAEMMELAADGPPGFEPGADSAYSNSNYILLGVIIEQATGRSAAEELRARIFEPLGMNSTHLLGAEETPGIEVHGYLPQPNGEYDFTHLWNGTSAWTAGAVVSTAADILRFSLALFDGELVDKALLAEMMREAPEGSGYGLGLLVGPDWIGHTGAVPGWLSQWLHFDGGVTTVVLQNRYDYGEGLQWATLGALQLLE